MKNVIELLGERLADAAKAIEARLTEKYAITDFQIQISNRFHTYNLNCTDAVNDFVTSYNDNLEAAIEGLEKQLTTRSEIAKGKRAKAKRLLVEAAVAYQRGQRIGAQITNDMSNENDIQTTTTRADSPAPTGYVASCVRCGEKLKGVMALSATLCGLCADDEPNARAREENSVLGPEGCCFPGNCCMPGPHYESECHTPEMLMAQEGEPHTEKLTNRPPK